METQAVQQTPQVGRPSKYTPQIVGKMLGTLQAGLSVESACEYAGINPDTHYQWLKDYPEYSEKVSGARMYGKILASKQVTDILQDTTRDKPKYSETTRATTARWYLEKHEKQIYGSQSMLAAKVESDGKGGQTATVIYATDNQLDQLLTQLATTAGGDEVNPRQLLEIPAPSPQEEDVAGGADQGRPAPVHTEELPHQHPENQSLPQP